MFPFQGMPVWAQWLGNLLPLTYFNRLIRGTKPGDVVMLLVRYQSQTSFVAVTAPKR